MIKELKAEEFTERLSAISEPVFKRHELSGRRPANRKYFYDNWKKLMEAGIAHSWELTEGGMLGALFAPDIYRGTLMGLVIFWFCADAAKKSGKALQLLQAFEAAARDAGCEQVCISAHAELRHDAVCRLHRMRGYRRLETVFCKDLWEKYSEP